MFLVVEVTLGCVKDFGNNTDQSDVAGSLYNSVRGTENGLGWVCSTNRLTFDEQFVVYNLDQACLHFVLTIKLNRMPGLLHLFRLGNHVALYTMHYSKIPSMGDNPQKFKIFGLGPLDAAPLDKWRAWECFLVVNTGDGKIALYNPCHCSFVVMCSEDSEWHWLQDWP